MTTLTTPSSRAHSNTQDSLIRQRLRGYSNHQALMFQSIDAVSTAISDMLQQIRVASSQK